MTHVPRLRPFSAPVVLDPQARLCRPPKWSQSVRSLVEEVEVSQPRFLLVQGTVERGVCTPEWPSAEHRRLILGRPDGAWFSWRLLSGNNREIGRGAVVYDTEAACLAAVDRVHRRAPACVPMISASPSGWWSWQVELDGELVAVARRFYQRQRECLYSLEQFRSALPQARIAALAPTEPVRRPGLL